MDMSGHPEEATDRPEKLRLKVVGGNAAGSVIEVEDELVIGRQASDAGSLGNDIEMSRQHARIWCGPDGRYLIEDLGSTNGTALNAREVQSATTLEPGDRIEVGASALVVQVSSVPPTPRSTPITTSAPMESASSTPAEPVAEENRPDATPGPAGSDPGGLPSRIPRLGLRIDVDLEAGEVTVVLDDDACEIKLLHDDDGGWRPA